MTELSKCEICGEDLSEKGIIIIGKVEIHQGCFQAMTSDSYKAFIERMRIKYNI